MDVPVWMVRLFDYAFPKDYTLWVNFGHVVCMLVTSTVGNNAMMVFEVAIL
jgi:hypothetical protein